MGFVKVFLILGLATSAFCFEVTDDIIERLARLEATEREHKQEIAALKGQMAAMEGNFLKRENEMLLKMNEIRGNCEEYGEETESEHYPDNKPLKLRSFTGVRDVVEKEVAFYARLSEKIVTNLGRNQIIAFNHTVTNIGNACNGVFTAPVDGTYVFHVTLMGLLHNATDTHYSAFIDVDGVAYSMFWIPKNAQLSRMLIIELKSGNVVSVKNGRIDDGVAGHHYSSFSGFLLYPHNHEPAIIGK